MEILYKVLLGITVLLAVAFTALVYFTGKGDAMSGGASGVRTSFKGKASFEDQISRITLMMAGGFMVLCLVLDFLAHRTDLK